MKKAILKLGIALIVGRMLAVFGLYFLFKWLWLSFEHYKVLISVGIVFYFQLHDINETLKGIKSRINPDVDEKINAFIQKLTK